MSFKTYEPKKIEKIFDLIKETWPVSGPFTVERIENNIVIKKHPEFWKDYVEIDRTDGIGTKGLLHWQMKTFSFAAQDAFAMNANDLIRIGAEPYKLQNHITIEEENDDAIFSIIRSLADLCKRYKIGITSGETAILNTMKGFEIGIIMTGKVKKNEIIKPHFEIEDKLIGLASSGIHSNGITLARKIITNSKFEKELVKPTEIYLEAIKEVLKNYREYVHGMVHITGGAFAKLKDTLNERVDIKIERNHKLKPQEIFKMLKEKGNLSDGQMYKTFNNGIGFILIIDEKVVDDILNTLRKYHKADVIGYVKKGTGQVKIESEFSNKTILL